MRPPVRLTRPVDGFETHDRLSRACARSSLRELRPPVALVVVHRGRHAYRLARYPDGRTRSQRLEQLFLKLALYLARSGHICVALSYGSVLHYSHENRDEATRTLDLAIGDAPHAAMGQAARPHSRAQEGGVVVRRALIALAVGLAALFVATYVTNDRSIMQVHRYSGTNAGVFVDLSTGHWCGFEYRGTVGPFCDVT